MPISRRFWTTQTTSTLAMPTATISATNVRIVPVEMSCALIAASSCSFVRIHDSTVSPVCASSLRASASAPNRSATLRSICEAPPGSASSVCAVRNAR